MIVQIYYANNQVIRDAMFKEIEVKLGVTHMKVSSMSFPVHLFKNKITEVKEVLEAAFGYFNWVQDEFECPESFYNRLKKRNELLERHGADQMEMFHHSSMSVGDMVSIDDTYYMCDSVGWKEVQVNRP